jgi:hypothetical protein
MNPPARIEPPAAVIDAARRWLAPVRDALGADFLATYLTGSVLSAGFDSKHSRVNVLVIARSLAPEVLDRIADALPDARKAPRFDALFMTREQIVSSLDVFPIEWLDLIERHLRLEGEDIFTGIEVPRTYLRLQCEHELRSKHLRLRHEYLLSAHRPERLAEVLARLASGFHTLFRTLLRLRGEEPPADIEALIKRVADAYQLDAGALLSAHLTRYTTRRTDGAVAHERYRKFLVEIERLVDRIDRLTTA